MQEMEILEQRIAEAQDTLTSATGAASLCTVSRSGIPMPGVKYPEGAWVALRDVRRDSSASGGVSVALHGVRQRWSTDLDRHTAAGSGPDWVAYLTGGLDALDDLAQNLESVTSRTSRSDMAAPESS